MAHKDLIDYVAVYEDLMENRDRVLKDMFNATNIPEKYISDVHSAFEKHSQVGFVILHNLVWYWIAFFRETCMVWQAKRTTTS